MKPTYYRPVLNSEPIYWMVYPNGDWEAVCKSGVRINGRWELKHLDMLVRNNVIVEIPDREVCLL